VILRPAGIHSLLFPAALALRHPPGARLFPGRQRASRPAPRRRHRHRAEQPARGRPLLAATLVQGEDVFRAWTPGHAQPLEHSARAAGAEVVEAVGL